MEKLLEDEKFDKYWVGYLGAHTDDRNRMCHYVGTVFGVVGGFLGLVYIHLLAGLLIGVVGYSVALIGHFVFQKNSPHATQPHLGLVCDFLMLYLFIFNRSKLSEQLARVRVRQSV